MTTDTIDIDVAKAEEVIGLPMVEWGATCHQTSLALIKAGLFPEGARVARGWSDGISSQHSWVAVGNPYDEDTPIVDPIRQHYVKSQDGIWYGTLRDKLHRPHGAGFIWEWGKPERGDGDIIVLDGKLSAEAQDFLRLLGPLDFKGWHQLLVLAPVQGWPAGEIMTAADKDTNLAAILPIDRVGMVTEQNPGELYF